jgi:subtilisin family serine protease
MGSGTSQATPFVAGAAALMWEKNASRSSSQIASLLASTARDLGASGFDTTYGHGALDAGAAVEAA